MVMIVTALRDFRIIKFGIPKIPLRSTVIEHLKEHTSVSDNERASSPPNNRACGWNIFE